MKIKPPFRADHVGSLLRMPELKKAKELFSAGNIDREQLRAIEDECVKKVVKIQQDAGMQSITDGEQRREFFHVDFLERIGGVKAVYGEYEIKFRAENKDVSLRPPILLVEGKLRRPVEGIALSDYKFLSSQVSLGAIAKVCIPSPSMLHFRGGRDGIDKAAYPDMDNFFSDLVDVYRQEIADLYKAGCRYLQLDDTNLAYLCDPEHCARVKAIGEDPDTLPALYAKLITECLRDVPQDMTVGMHLCRGNHKSAWAAEGGYEPVAETMFNETGVDTFFLEYDDPRSGDFSPLRFIPKDKTVVLGLISSKLGKLESRDTILKRVDDASAHIDLNQCCLSPQCGFSSTHEGNDLSFAEQSAKLKLVVSLADEIWKDEGLNVKFA